MTYEDPHYNERIIVDLGGTWPSTTSMKRGDRARECIKNPPNRLYVCMPKLLRVVVIDPSWDDIPF